MSDLFDVTIIGGGTTGLYTAFYSGMRDLKTKVIEYQPHMGGKVSFFYPEKKIYDVGGFLGVKGEELVQNVEEQAAFEEPAIVSGEKIISIEKKEDGSFELTNEQGGKHRSRTVIIASGLGTFEMQPFEVTNSESFQEFIHYTVQWKNQYEGKKVAVVSDSRVGIDWSLALEGIASSVDLINRGEKFKAASEKDVGTLESSNVRVHWQRTVETLDGEEKLEQLTLDNGEVLEVDDILVYEGLHIDKSLYEEWGLKTEKGRIPVEPDMRSNIDGVFVAGDAAIYNGKTMLIASGFNEAMAAVNSAAQYLNPKASPQVYSTVIYKHHS
ncbi:NAD(P)/FAD-dependent oxidoreductase [Halobacillus litoralis]|uniref:NAD(P)/FAD-dependent oxidoreductase n=1 Tax=Halobacillus litoralis TaxID=45668 RepID=UPI001CD521AF|nr:NAD(P)/FAD-dependent oxidoreductase [Halobacillus litoralis]MCA0972459.1 NAD(P)/FAD-dependent oxidoreductase [Halobacillus litoralis]